MCFFDTDCREIVWCFVTYLLSHTKKAYAIENPGAVRQGAPRTHLRGGGPDNSWRWPGYRHSDWHCEAPWLLSLDRDQIAHNCWARYTVAVTWIIMCTLPYLPPPLKQVLLQSTAALPSWQTALTACIVLDKYMCLDIQFVREMMLYMCWCISIMWRRTKYNACMYILVTLINKAKRILLSMGYDNC